MNFLELVQELHDISGATSVAPRTTLDQQGQAGRLVRWVAAADFNWQSRWENWAFLFKRTANAFRLSAGGVTEPPADLRTWDQTTFMIRETPTDSWQPLQVARYEEVKGDVSWADNEEGFPYAVSVLPNRSLQFYPAPDRDYLLRADYFRRPVRLVNPTDVSPIPEEYHSTVIIGAALMYYGYFSDAREIIQEGQDLVSQGRAQLESHELPSNGEWFMGQSFQIGEQRY